MMAVTSIECGDVNRRLAVLHHEGLGLVEYGKEGTEGAGTETGGSEWEGNRGRP